MTLPPVLLQLVPCEAAFSFSTCRFVPASTGAWGSATRRRSMVVMTRRGRDEATSDESSFCWVARSAAAVRCTVQGEPAEGRA